MTETLAPEVAPAEPAGSLHPYPGPRPFHREERQLFFGRDREQSQPERERERAPHTFRTRARPKSPDGLISSTISISTKVAGSSSCGVTQLT